MMASADAAVAAHEDSVPAAEPGSRAAVKPTVSKTTAKASPSAAKKPVRPVAADMPPSPVKAGPVLEREGTGPSEEVETAPVAADVAPATPPAVEAEPAEALAVEPTVAPAAATPETDPPPPRISNQQSGMRPGQHGGPNTMPRMPAKAEIFVEGDHVVYPTHGVGKVERIATEEIAGHRLELIHITFEENRMTLRVPVAKARSAGLRKLATRKMFDDALAVLKGRARIKRTMWSRRAQEYEAKINSGDPLAIAEVVRDLHRNAGQPDQSFSERQIYEAAMDRLAAELAALDKTDKPTAVTKLTEFLKTV
jgi:CarD family transcriptional regulator